MLRNWLTKFLIVLSVLTLILSCAEAVTSKGESKPNWKRIKTIENDDAVTIFVKGKKRNYTKLSSVYKSVITVDGPVKILVRTRLVMTPDHKGDQKYRVIYNRNNNVEKSFREKTRRSTRARFQKKKDAVLGSSMIYEFEVPPGRHKYSFKTEKGTVLARFYQKPIPKKINWEPLTIDSADKKVYIAEASKKISTYYPLKKDQTISFFVTGPVQLKIMSRLDFTQAMAGKQRYSLILQQDNGKQENFSFSTEKSKKYFYLTKKDILPSVAKAKVIPVPKGKHKYILKITGTQSSGSSIRILVAP